MQCAICADIGFVINRPRRVIGATYPLEDGWKGDEHFLPCPLCSQKDKARGGEEEMCLHEHLEATGCRFKWYCKSCQHWITFSFGVLDPCGEKWCKNDQCHNYGKKMNTDRTLVQVFAQFHNASVAEAIELGQRLSQAPS